MENTSGQGKPSDKVWEIADARASFNLTHLSILVLP